MVYGCGNRIAISKPVARQASSASHFGGLEQQWGAIGFSFSQHRPDHTQAGRLLILLQQDRVRSLHEQFAQILVPTLAGAGQLLLAAGGMLARNDSEPRCEPAALLESSSVSPMNSPEERSAWTSRSMSAFRLPVRSTIVPTRNRCDRIKVEREWTQIG
jgi:hypothetical protein